MEDIIVRLHMGNFYVPLDTILCQLNYRDILRARLVSHSWHHILADMNLWRRLLLKEMRRSPKFKNVCELSGWADRIRDPNTDQECHRYLVYHWLYLGKKLER